MANRQRSNVLQHLRRAALLRDGAGLSDGQLLNGFVARRDAACFEALVRRHGPMVLGVCRRVLGNPHDAEDAFQATFLVLVRRAASVVPRELVGNWLYGVAYRTALEARRTAARRQARERQVHDMPRPAAEPDPLWHELVPLFDEELDRLPDRYRAAVVLCDLQGRTRKEAARQLGVPEGTVSGRLTTARRMLARRLSRRGVALSAGAIGAVLASGTASAAVPASLVASTVQTAAATTVAAPVIALADRVVKGLFLARLKKLTATALLAVGLVAGGVLTHRLVAAESQQEASQEGAPRTPATDRAEQSDLDKLQGTWVAVSSEWDGKKVSGPPLRGYQLVIARHRLTYHTPRKTEEASIELRPAGTPPEMDMKFNEWGVTRAIYELDGKRLKVRWTKTGSRPTGFDTNDGDFLATLFVYEKQQ
jgi:RNA polymerase sigma factor (sigma-70 family)